MTQLRWWGLASSVWGLAWTGMLLGTLYDDDRLLAWGLFVGLAGVLVMVWIIATHILAGLEDRILADLSDRDRRRTAEMADALVRAQHDTIRLVD